MDNTQFKYRFAFTAALILAVSMGFGRFSFTVIYPYMIQEDILNLQNSGFIASANYFGYLLGSLFAIKINTQNAQRICIYATLGSIFCLANLSITSYFIIILLLRTVAGVFSALAMISASTWLFQCCKQPQYSPLLYAGVGLGIALSAECIVLAEIINLTSHGLWLLLTLLSLVIGLFIIRNLNMMSSFHLPITKNNLNHINNINPLFLIIIYALSGFGYIITATYLPLLAQGVFTQIHPAHLWAIFGLAAIPSCFIWGYLQQKFQKTALVSNLFVQGMGIIMPILLPTKLGYFISAILVGGTFMGTVTLIMYIAQSITHQHQYNLIALMTIAYSLGQIFGPVITNTILFLTNSITYSLMLAALALCVASLISIKIKF